MAAAVYCRDVVPRRRACHPRQTRFSPWHTGSAVTSAFFPPPFRCRAGPESPSHAAPYPGPQQRQAERWGKPYQRFLRLL